MNGFGQESEKSNKPDLDIESFNLSLSLKTERIFSALRPGDMDALRNRLSMEGKSEELIDAVVWRFRNSAGLCQCVEPDESRVLLFISKKKMWVMPKKRKAAVR